MKITCELKFIEKGALRRKYIRKLSIKVIAKLLILCQKMHSSVFLAKYQPWPNAPQDVAQARDSQELIFCGGRVEHGDLLVDEECVWDPDELDVLSPHHQLVNPKLVLVKAQSGVTPILSEVHVKSEVHELLRQVPDAEDVEADAHSDGDAPVVGPHPPIIADLKII